MSFTRSRVKRWQHRTESAIEELDLLDRLVAKCAWITWHVVSLLSALLALMTTARQLLH